jgi:hypothetical protein
MTDDERVCRLARPPPVRQRRHSAGGTRLRRLVDLDSGEGAR